MEKVTVDGIREILNASEEPIDCVMFSGHSAGGAIAQIFYAMTMSPNTALAQATASTFPTVTIELST